MLRSLYRYHVVSSGWRDIGYNFAVDKCGTVYEGRAGGVAKAVQGAHTMGFNTDSMGIAVIGTYTTTAPPAAAVKAVAQLTAWKLGLFNRDPRAKTTLKSGGGNLFAKGTNVKLNVISGHRDGFATECPGKLLYGQLPRPAPHRPSSRAAPRGCPPDHGGAAAGGRTGRGGARGKAEGRVGDRRRRATLNGMAGRFDPLTRTAVRGGRTTVPAGTGTSAGTAPTGARARALARTWTPEGVVDLGLTLGPLRRGPADPTFRTTPDGSVWKTSRTPRARPPSAWH